MNSRLRVVLDSTCLSVSKLKICQGADWAFQWPKLIIYRIQFNDIIHMQNLTFVSQSINSLEIFEKNMKCPLNMDKVGTDPTGRATFIYIGFFHVKSTKFEILLIFLIL